MGNVNNKGIYSKAKCVDIDSRAPQLHTCDILDIIG